MTQPSFLGHYEHEVEPDLEPDFPRPILQKYLVEEHEYDTYKVEAPHRVTFHIIVEADAPYPPYITDSETFQDAFGRASKCKRGGFWMQAIDLVEVEPGYLWACGDGAWAYEVRRLDL